ncbi:helix-turn-helix domain-containing protein [Bacillus sp. REN3]|uniref:PucR family transcriptional regulator n=1 Tax=Bacillus sp. REN3 TaxID=2802440 RepID=UPI001AEE4A5E|nr:helix-turn-helix domain-containing protein [Bacillus sp. REN3]
MEQTLHIPSIVNELIISSQKGIDELSRILSSLLSVPVLATDSYYQTLAFSSPDPEGSLGTILAIQQLDRKEHSPISYYQITTVDDDLYACGTPIVHSGNLAGYLFIMDGKEPDERGADRSILLFAASLIALQLNNKIELRKEKLKFKEPFLFDLLYGNIKQIDEIVEYGKVWKWNLALPQTVMVFSLQDFNHLSTDKKLIDKILHIIERKLQERNIEPITMARGSQVTMIVSHDDKAPGPALRKLIESFARDILGHLRVIHPEREFSCGIGKTYAKATELFRSFQEAKVALELGELLEIEVPFFSDLGLERILYKHDLQELKEFFDTTLGQLAIYDQSNQTELMDTLKAFAENQFDITVTSKALFLHRNTLRYRLKKIEEILHYKLDDLDTKLNIKAAFKIKQLRKL